MKFVITTKEQHAKIPSPSSQPCFGGGFDNFITVDDLVKEQIMHTLRARNRGENIIGLHGPDIRVKDSVKTAIRRAERDQLFQLIVTATVTKKPHLRNIQSQIGAAMGLSFDDEAVKATSCMCFANNKRMSTAERASRLCAKMKELQTVLVVLYDLHGRLDLGQVGIPFATDHNGCKIILTSPSEEVLSNQMKAHNWYKYHRKMLYQLLVILLQIVLLGS